MQGLEFVVAYDPLQAAAQSETSFAHEPSNVWVIRKQTRRKRSGLDDEVAVLATLFVVGDCIYMAPSVASIVGNRIVRLSLSLVIHLGGGNKTNWIAFGRDIPHQYAQNSIYVAYVYVVLRAYLYAPHDYNDQVDRTRPEPDKQRGKHTYARCRFAGQDLHGPRGVRDRIKFAGYEDAGGIVQPAVAVWRGVHG